MRALCLLALAASVLPLGCVRHIYPVNEKIRVYEPEAYDEEAQRTLPGSLWRAGSPGLFTDARARRVGDILTVRVEEQSDASRGATTQTARESESSVGISAFLGAMQRLASQVPGLDPAALVSAASATSFKGGGRTSRSGSLRATLPVRIKKRLPNGDFFVEGRRALLLNDEETFLYLSGVVRPLDIAPDNSVSSSLLADVELEYTGRGVVSERQSPGWLARVLDYVWPF